MSGLRMGDVWGGMSASALVLPQAMAFGIALWSPYAMAPAAAAMSGLVAAACLCGISGLFRGTEGLVASPTGPTLVLLSGSIAALAATGLSGERLVTATLLTVAMGGVFQVLIGVLNLGHLIKFIPYPVVSGFMTGSAILMINSQVDVVLGGDAGLSMGQGGWIPAAAAAVTLIAMIYLPRWIKQVPGTVSGLVAGTLAFHLFAQWQPESLPGSWVVGSLPGLGDLHIGFSLSQPDQLPWLLMLGSALALAVLASLDTLLTAVLADVSTGGRHQARRELMGQGGGHVLSALVGGMAGAGTTGATLVSIQSGGRQWAGAVTAICMLLLILFMGPLAALLPISVFAAIILYVAIFSMLDKDIIRWLRTPQARMDAVIALIVTAVTVFYDLMLAVGLGVLLATVEFIHTQVHSAVVQRRWNLAERASLRRRLKSECCCLNMQPDAIVGYDLKGTLFFGTTDHLYDALLQDLQQARYIILDMRRITQVDLTAVRLIEHMYGMMGQHGGELILASEPRSMGLVKRHGHRHEKLVPYHDNIHLRTFSDVDRALEYAEDQLLLEHCHTLHDQDIRIELEESELLAGLSSEDQAVILPFFEQRTLKNKAFLFRTGEHGEALYVVLSGEIEVFLPYGKKKQRLRLATYGAGMTVGEGAFLEPGPRMVDARSNHHCMVAVLQHAAFQRLCEQHSDVGMRLLMRIGHDMSESLRLADEKLRRLAG